MYNLNVFNLVCFSYAEYSLNFHQHSNNQPWISVCFQTYYCIASQNRKRTLLRLHKVLVGEWE